MGKYASASKPYQGVRVKDPVKELLRRKRGNGTRPAPLTTTMMVANNTLPSYTHAGTFTEATQTGLNDSVMDVGGLCTGWIAQTTSTTALQPLSHWSPTDCQQQDPTLHSHTADMYVQPICPSYTVVGPSSMFTLGHTPLFTNLGAVSTSNSTLPQVEVPDLTYIPWAQSLSTISCPVMQAPSMPTALSGPQLFPVPLTLPVFSPEPEQEKPPQAPEGSLALEKLLEEDEGHKETYICNPSLFSEDI
ncbi:POU domain class 2-associating factor 1 isoform X1 [Triplophysa dalaica]|uniref:POU domain class 2-associating factor 1 isoform X1 n=2 Tax=Triplophysa dalaica TaxID=1582913 RepID=UPI0024DFB45A|nr:POU domain class 2-associating factor 1 isoform X1 [Triplophysa dalaica]